MALIQTVAPENARGIRWAFFAWVKRQYGGVVPGVFQVLAVDLKVPSHPPSTRNAGHRGQRQGRWSSLTGPPYGGGSSPHGQ